jgi:hypothetical protein
MLNKNDKKKPTICTHFTLFFMGLGANIIKGGTRGLVVA